MERGTVVNRKRDGSGISVGTRHDNPMLDTRFNEAEFFDENENAGYSTANMIAENIYASVDAEVNECVLFKYVVDHKRDKSNVTADITFCLQEIEVTLNQEEPLLVGIYVLSGKMAQPSDYHSRS